MNGPPLSRVEQLEKRVCELENVVMFQARVLRGLVSDGHLPERVALKQVSEGFPLRGLNLPAAQRERMTARA